ncbi:MAG: hypothetical protein M3O50_02905 [Myxococcota bacterium]|nr:hypothetical protein [Myxococcota bacterium]
MAQPPHVLANGQWGTSPLAAPADDRPALGGENMDRSKSAMEQYRGIAILAVAALTGGCTTAVGYAPAPAPVGSVVMDWTVNGGKDPGECQLSGAAEFDVKLYNSRGEFAGEYVQTCTSFATTINGLLPDTYTGLANLRDANGAARTTTVTLLPFDVGNTVSTVNVDFPSNSFL